MLIDVNSLALIQLLEIKVVVPLTLVDKFLTDKSTTH